MMKPHLHKPTLRSNKPRLKMQHISMAGKSAFPGGPAAFPPAPGMDGGPPMPGAPGVGPAMAPGPTLAAPGDTGQ